MLWTVEVVKEKRWVFEQSDEVEKKIIVSETNCGSWNKKNHAYHASEKAFCRKW